MSSTMHQPSVSMVLAPPPEPMPAKHVGSALVGTAKGHVFHPRTGGTL